MPDIEITEKDWAKIEKAYGRAVSTDARAAILEACESFVYFEIFERTAEPLDLAIKRARLIEKASMDLAMTLASGKSDAATYVNHLLKKHFFDPRIKAPSHDLLRAVAGIITSLSSASAAALKEMSAPEQQGHREGECWEQWVRRLGAIAKKNGLPIGVAKSADNKSSTHSPFVRMVEALQSCLPSDARRHAHSASGLAVAIYRARVAKAPKNKK